MATRTFGERLPGINGLVKRDVVPNLFNESVGGIEFRSSEGNLEAFNRFAMEQLGEEIDPTMRRDLSEKERTVLKLTEINRICIKKTGEGNKPNYVAMVHLPAKGIYRDNSDVFFSHEIDHALFSILLHQHGFAPSKKLTLLRNIGHQLMSGMPRFDGGMTERRNRPSFLASKGDEWEAERFRITNLDDLEQELRSEITKKWFPLTQTPQMIVPNLPPGRTLRMRAIADLFAEKKEALQSLDLVTIKELRIAAKKEEAINALLEVVAFLKERAH